MVMAAERDRELLTVEEAMERLNCRRTTIYKLAHEGKLEIVRFSPRMTRITNRSITALLDKLLEDSKAPPLVPDDDE